MKIYKTTLADLLQEAKGTIYLSAHLSQKNGWTQHIISVNGFNAGEKCLCYTFTVNEHFDTFDAEFKKGNEKSIQLCDQIKKECSLAGFVLLDGNISDEVVKGLPFKRREVAA